MDVGDNNRVSMKISVWGVRVRVRIMMKVRMVMGVRNREEEIYV